MFVFPRWFWVSAVSDRRQVKSCWEAVQVGTLSERCEKRRGVSLLLSSVGKSLSAREKDKRGELLFIKTVLAS